MPWVITKLCRDCVDKLRRGLPGRLHLRVHGRGPRHVAEPALHRPRGVHRLRRVRARVPVGGHLRGRARARRLPPDIALNAEHQGREGRLPGARGDREARSRRPSRWRPTRRSGATRTDGGRGAVADTLGRPLRDLRISVTDRCNFRCRYCMPAELFGERYAFLPEPEILSFEEIERLARLFVRLGAKKLRLTGGEPLLRADLPRWSAARRAPGRRGPRAHHERRTCSRASPSRSRARGCRA